MKYFILSAFFMLLGLSVTTGYQMLGGRISESGMLDEPFFLVPLSLVCFVIASVLMVIGLAKRHKNND